MWKRNADTAGSDACVLSGRRSLTSKSQAGTLLGKSSAGETPPQCEGSQQDDREAGALILMLQNAGWCPQGGYDRATEKQEGLIFHLCTCATASPDGKLGKKLYFEQGSP